jgi:hypothetical protein
LTTKDKNRTLAAYAEKARSALYGETEDAHPLGTIEAFLEAEKIKPTAAQGWLLRLGALTDDTIREELQQVPPNRITAVAVDFASALLRHNRDRLLATRNQI